MRHPKDKGKPEIETLLTALAAEISECTEEAGLAPLPVFPPFRGGAAGGETGGGE